MWGTDEEIDGEFNSVCRTIWGYTLDDFDDDRAREKVLVVIHDDSWCFYTSLVQFVDHRLGYYDTICSDDHAIRP